MLTALTSFGRILGDSWQTVAKRGQQMIQRSQYVFRKWLMGLLYIGCEVCQVPGAMMRHGEPITVPPSLLPHLV